jgi:hypothetical protein
VKNIFVYQIYYDDKTRAEVEPGFKPIDNTHSLHPELFEFWVILKYLRENDLYDDTWYGFLSPKFNTKTGLTAQFVENYLSSRNPSTEVCLFSPSWDQLAYFLNPWEQGEVWHPGLTIAAQEFMDWSQLGIDLRHIVSDAQTAVFSNYVIAKKQYWQAWKILAERFFAYLESLSSDSSALQQTTHGARSRLYPMRTFIQERFPTLVLLMNKLNVNVPLQCSFSPLQPRIFPDASTQRNAFLACDYMKQKFNDSLDKDYLNMYWKIRQTIPYSPISF